MWVAITGGVGSGKSTVAQMLGSHGASLIDADAISRASTGPTGIAMPQIRTEFGDGFVAADGSLDRQAMREAAFAQPHLRERLEGIVHPIVRDEMLRQANVAPSSWVVFDIPLVHARSPWRSSLQQIWVVDCTEATQRSRVRDRNGWDDATIDRVMAAQPSRHERRALADAVLFNDGLTLDALAQSVSSWVGRLKAAGIIRA
jgi:dephospho-CoA kinase